MTGLPPVIGLAVLAFKPGSSPHPSICPNHCSSSFITVYWQSTEKKKHALKQTVIGIYLLHCSLGNFKYKHLHLESRTLQIQCVHSSIHFPRNKIVRKTEKELQTSYTLIYHHLAKTWYCSCETDIEVTKSDLEDTSNFKTEGCHCTWYPARFQCAET